MPRDEDLANPIETHAGLERLGRGDRLRLGTWPTPLTPLLRFSAELDAEVWIKRDDFGSLGLAGNKIRKLELELGRAMNVGASAVVTVGAQQSNVARATAAACAQLGLECHLVLPGPAPALSAGNLLLDRLFGAQLHFVDQGDWQSLDRGAAKVVADLSAAGQDPYSIPLGASSALGALGFAAAYVELHQQLVGLGVVPATIVHASSSGGTHAGLLVGRELAGGGPRLRAIEVATGIYPDVRAQIAQVASEAAALLNVDYSFTSGDIELDERWLGPGYAEPTSEGIAAIKTLARTEAIVCDPVYTGKALAATVDLASRVDGPVVFWHTGGYHSVFTERYARSLTSSGASS